MLSVLGHDRLIYVKHHSLWAHFASNVFNLKCVNDNDLNGPTHGWSVHVADGLLHSLCASILYSFTSNIVLTCGHSSENQSTVQFQSVMERGHHTQGFLLLRMAPHLSFSTFIIFCPYRSHNLSHPKQFCETIQVILSHDSSEN